MSGGTGLTYKAPVLGGIKHDGEKPRLDLLPFDAVTEIAKVMTFGAAKYSDRNWEKGFVWGRLLGAALRHLFAWARREAADPETGLSHLAHAGCCVLFLLAHELRGLGTDDRTRAPLPQTASEDAGGYTIIPATRR